MFYPTLESDQYGELSKYQELLYDDVRNNKYDVHVVGHTKAESPSEVFIEYTVIIEASEEEYTIRRRYSDFEWLMNQLYNKYPFHILPPMPSKRFISTINKFSRAFIDKRQVALNVMMQRLCHIKECMLDVETHTFLKTSQKEFDLYKLNHKNPSFFSLLRHSFRLFYGGTLLNIGSNDAWKDDATISYLDVLRQRNIDRTLMTRILESTEWMLERWEEYSFALLWLAQDVADLVLMMDKSDLVVYMDGVAQLFFNLSTEGKSHYNFISLTIEPIFKEYVAYNDNLIKIIKHRKKMKAIYYSKNKSLRLLTARGGSDDFEDQSKGNRLDELSKETIILEEDLSRFDNTFPSSLSTWQRQRSKDMARCVDVIVTSNIKYHKACLDLCIYVLRKIESDS